jgi:hypothetical protein
MLPCAVHDMFNGDGVIGNMVHDQVHTLHGHFQARCYFVRSENTCNVSAIWRQCRLISSTKEST